MKKFKCQIVNWKLLIDSNYYNTRWLIFLVNHLIKYICINSKEDALTIA